MNEKGSPILLILAALCFCYWASFPVVPDPTQCDLIDSTPLIEEVAQVEFIGPPKEPDPMPSPLIFVPRHEIDPQPSPSDKPREAIKRKILVFLAPKGEKCPPCEQWKACEMKRFMDANWDVAIFDQPHTYPTPTFEIKSGEKKATIKGYTTLEQAAEAVR
jgi:hypothetical protein